MIRGMNNTMNISKYVRRVRGDLNQKKFASLIWPDDNPVLARNRIAKYERGFAIPPGDVLLKIQELEKQLKAA